MTKIKQTRFHLALAPDHQQEMDKLTGLVEFDISEKERLKRVETIKVTPKKKR
jgi:hypothetical protein